MNMHLGMRLALAVAISPAQAAELSAADKAAIDAIALQWRRAHPEPGVAGPTWNRTAPGRRFDDGNACRVLAAPPPLPSGASGATVVVEVHGKSASKDWPGSVNTYIVDLAAGEATVVRERTRYVPEARQERPGEFDCQTWTTVTGEKTFRVTSRFRLNGAEAAEAQARAEDLAGMRTRNDAPLDLYQRPRCLVPQDPRLPAWHSVDASASLLGQGFEMPSYQRLWAQPFWYSAGISGAPDHRLRLPGGPWQAVGAETPLGVAVSQWTHWLEHMTIVADTRCDTLHAQADVQGQVRYARERSALQAWASQASLLHGLCEPVQGWTFLAPEFTDIRTGYVIEHGDRIHQRDLHLAIAVDIERRRLLVSRVPGAVRQPRAWFSADPAVRASCGVIVPKRKNEATAYLQVVQWTEAEPDLIDAAQAFVQHVKAGRQPKPAPRVAVVPMHLPPNEWVRYDGQAVRSTDARGTDPVEQRFKDLLYRSAAYRKLLGD